MHFYFPSSVLASNIFTQYLPMNYETVCLHMNIHMHEKQIQLYVCILNHTYNLAYIYKYAHDYCMRYRTLEVKP